MKVYSYFLIKIFFFLPFALIVNGQDVIEDLNKSLSESFDNKDYNTALTTGLTKRINKILDKAESDNIPVQHAAEELANNRLKK